VRFFLLALVLLAACIPMLPGSKRARPCYKGCHGCGKCMKSFRGDEENEERMPSHPVN
jgi:hypothetical protein